MGIFFQTGFSVVWTKQIRLAGVDMGLRGNLAIPPMHSIIYTFPQHSTPYAYKVEFTLFLF